MPTGITPGSSARLTETRIPSSSISISPDPGLLDDLHELADPLGALGVDVAAEQRRLAGVALADRRQERLCLLAEHREQDEILFGRGEPVRGLPNVLGARRVLLERGPLGPPRSSTARRTDGSMGAGGCP